MKTFIAVAAAAVALSGCAGIPGTGGGADWARAAIEIAKDPACTHTDVLDVMLGPVPSGHVHLERSGCKTGAPVKAGPGPAPGSVVAPLAVGTVVAPAAPPAPPT